MSDSVLAKGDLCDQPGCPYFGRGADPKPADFPPCPHMGGPRIECAKFELPTLQFEMPTFPDLPKPPTLPDLPTPKLLKFVVSIRRDDDLMLRPIPCTQELPGIAFDRRPILWFVDLAGHRFAFTGTRHIMPRGAVAWAPLETFTF